MIYFIGGPPKCGKTTLAKQLSQKLDVPWMSADTLQNIVRAYIPEEHHAEMFPHSAARNASNDVLYGENSPEDIVARYVKQSEALHEALKMTATSYITDEDDFIIEGYQVQPKIVSQIIKEHGQEHISSVFLMRTDVEKFVADIPKSSTPNDWIIRKTEDPATYKKIAAMVALYSQQIETEAKQYQLPVVAMDDDFDAKVEEIIKLFTT